MKASKTETENKNEIIKLRAKLADTELRLKEEIQREEELEAVNIKLETDLKYKKHELSGARAQQQVMKDRLSDNSKTGEVEKLAAGVAHEIRNPLTFIGMTVQYVVDKLDDTDPNKNALRPIIEKIEKVKKVTQSLIQFARISELELKPVKVYKVFRSVAEILKPKCEMQKVTILEEFGDGLPEVIIDPDKMEKAVFNLADNAIKHMPEGGVLKIRADYNIGECLRITVTDSAKGIPKENSEKIFEPFFGTTGSSGLGLFVTKQIVEAHRGKIYVADSTDAGTTFCIDLPVPVVEKAKPVQDAVPEMKSPAVKPEDTSVKTIIESKKEVDRSSESENKSKRKNVGVKITF